MIKMPKGSCSPSVYRRAESSRIKTQNMKERKKSMSEKLKTGSRIKTLLGKTAEAKKTIDEEEQYRPMKSII